MDDNDKEPKVRKDGLPDGRGRSEGSRRNRFAHNDGRRRPGRSKGAKSFRTILREIDAMPVQIEVNGKKKKVQSTEAILLRQRQKALAGEDRASERLLARIEQYSPPDVQPDLTAEKIAEDLELLRLAGVRGLLLPPSETTGEADV